MISDEVRALIVSHLQAGRSVAEIAPIFSQFCKKRTLYVVAKELSAGVVTKLKKKQKRPWRKVDPKMAATIIRRLTVAKSEHSIRSVAKEMKISDKTIRKLSEKNDIKCYKKRKRNLIPMTQEAKRKSCCGNFRKTYRKTDMANFLFVDECYITVQKTFNCQNERCFGKSFEFIPDRKKFKQLPKSPLSAMIFGGVSRNCRTPLVVLKSGFRLNQRTYKTECVDFVHKNLPYPLKPETTIFYQDKAPCHAAISVQKHLDAIFPCHVPKDAMPPNSPDLNVLDYCVWSMLKERLNKYGHIVNFQKLKKLLKKEWKAIPQQAIQDSVDSWQSRARSVEKSNGGHIE